MERNAQRASNAWLGAGMGQADAAAVVALCAAVAVLLTVAEPRDRICYLLAFPVWIVAKDLGAAAGAFVGVLGFLLILAFGPTDGSFGPLGYAAFATVLAGAVASGDLVRRRPPARSRAGLQGGALRVLTARPDITRRADDLSRRELEVLEMIATGAKNSEIAERFVISENTVKSHVSQILKKLPAANRTQAAFRYVELYGAPSAGEGADGDDAPDLPEISRISAASAVSATVAAIRRRDKLVLSLQDGRELEVPMVDQIRDCVYVGAPAVAYFDQRDRLVGWYLPEQELGVDLRHWGH
jgi:DNA-binding CsgD family transcriptional regulator